MAGAGLPTSGGPPTTVTPAEPEGAPVTPQAEAPSVAARINSTARDRGKEDERRRVRPGSVAAYFAVIVPVMVGCTLQWK